MNVQVMHGLTTIIAGVDYNAIAIDKPLLSRDIAGLLEELAEFQSIICLRDTGDMVLGYDQSMCRCLSIDVANRDHLRRLFDYAGRYFAFDDFAENTGRIACTSWRHFVISCLKSQKMGS